MFQFTFIFLWLSWLLGNPFIAMIVLLVILYLIDRRFVGLSPSLLKPIKRRSHIRKLKNQIQVSPNDVSAKQELARQLIAGKRYKEALQILEPLKRVLVESAEYWDDLGTCYLQTNSVDEGETCILEALKLNERVKFGAPYLRLATIHVKDNSDKALYYLNAFQEIHSSSCEGYDRLATIYKGLGRIDDAKQAAEEGLRVYKSLPKYRKRVERKWAVRLLFKK
ncbi:tetratricopeptide repeat protein [Paenibacillus sp. GSMTC-2017]|uniref:tetratricopeptide repeat protein n=1 Tax=Paenibacillus sp. GSMTC-2017 TaxID=2794350 RepID=UPI0018D954BA|nr:tetratricopeptide repeat protein [Paenibacillus sp. GSMTC-2017]MBH5318507.1 tetratricopeptide repeat protein [Paenibacillus sp. GSMTC-2017]